MHDIAIRDGLSNMDFDRVEELLSRSYWAPGIKREEILKSAIHSALVVGAFMDDRQIGYLRVISDKTRFAYISDVFVDEHYRGRGAARGMLNHALSHPSLQDVYQWLLRTTDAHGLYEKLGFSPITQADRLMEIRKPRPER